MAASRSTGHATSGAASWAAHPRAQLRRPAGARLATLGEDTIRALDAVLPATWSRANPVDIIGDAPAERYRKALDILLETPDADAVLYIQAPTAIVDSTEIARALVGPLTASKWPVFASWLGADAVAEARRIFEDAGIPTYATPEDATRAFLHLVRYHATRRALNEGREILTEPEAKALLAAYGVAVVETRIAVSPEDAAGLAAGLGFPVAVKLLSPDVTHKSDVGGVALDLETAEAVEAAARGISRRLAELRPDARIDGFTVQPMARRPGAHELIVGAATDPTFGPVVLFGHGGTAIEVVADRAVALLPLNMNLARETVSLTRVARLLAGYRDRPAADIDAICRALIAVSRLITDFAEVAEIDVNPLLADDRGAIALDARVRVVPTEHAAATGPCIRPYPAGLEKTISVGGVEIILRPVRPEDEPLYRALIESLDPEDAYFRFFAHVKRLTHAWLARLTQIDYDREMAFLALHEGDGGAALGAVRVIFDPDNTVAEFAVLVRSDFKRRGLGRALMTAIIDHCRGRGTAEIMGRVVPGNARMLELARDLGFAARFDADKGVMEVRLALDTDC